MKLLYFAWVKSKTGLAEEVVTPPVEVRDVAGLMAWLKQRGAGYADAFADEEALRVAVNQDYARPGDPVGGNDEVAFFPPVTGG